MKAGSAEIEAVLHELRALLPELRRRYGVSSLAVFGSAVRGEAGPDSDLDILVEFETPPGLFAFVRLEDEISARLGRKVDLVMRSALKPRLAGRILDEAVPV
ncbi:MAG TPA: nucleotidyltransferase [Rhodospirillales bacterium]|nr:nucleotidyltransferase [Rhodospirillales bacterium]